MGASYRGRTSRRRGGCRHGLLELHSSYRVNDTWPEWRRLREKNASGKRRGMSVTDPAQFAAFTDGDAESEYIDVA